MKKFLLLAVLVVAIAAAPAFASVQNVKVGGDIDSTWLIRNNFDLGANLFNDEEQNLFITQTRVRIEGELTDKVNTVVALINERAWGTENDPASNDTDIDINVAMVTIKEILNSPATLHIGRQNDIRYGNGFIFDSQGTNNTATGALGSIAADLTKRSAIDAIRLVLDYQPLTLDLLYSKIDANTLTSVPDDRDDIDLYGANANYQLGDKMNTEAEAYFFAKIDKSTDNVGSTSDKSDTIYLPGVRVSTNPIEGLNLQGEIAWQRGNKVYTTTALGNNQRRDAMGAQAIANYQVPALQEWKPVVTGVYTYTSGDKSKDTELAYFKEASREVYQAWDPFFENQAGGTIYNTLFNLTNSHIFSVAGQVSPMEDVTAKFTWTGLWSAKEARQTSITLIQPDGNTSTTAEVTTDKQVGNEFDGELIYALTEDVTLGALAGIFLPGDMFDTRNAFNNNANGNNESVASQFIVHGNVNF